MPALLTVPEVAEIFRVSQKTVSYWRATGKLRSLRTPGRGVRFKREDVLAILENVK
jgi:excisionase family DNA binding protein